MIEQALRHAKQALSLYGYTGTLEYKLNTDGSYSIRGTLQRTETITSAETTTKKNGGYTEV